MTAVRSIRIASNFILVFSSIVAVTMPGAGAGADPPPSGPSSIQLAGAIRDFSRDHPDFSVHDATATGQYAFQVSAALGSNRRPVFMGGGLQVLTQWYDKDNNAIKPSPLEIVPEGETEFCTYNLNVHVGDTFNIRDYVHYKDGGTVNWGSVSFTYTEAGANNATSPAEWHLDDFNNGLPVTIVDADDDIGTGNVGPGKYRIYVMRASEPTTDDHMTIRIRDSGPSDVVSAMCDSEHDADNPGCEGHGHDRVAICHNGHTIHVADPAVINAHLLHGDSLGECTTDSCGNQMNDTDGTFGGMGSGAITSSDTFAQWFRDIGGVNLSMDHSITLTNDGTGVYEYLTNSFYPADELLLGNESDSHNNYFTYSIFATFTYDACTDQFFEFEGNDDCWVFIDYQLAIDLGGVDTPSRQFVALDRLGLTDGEVYTLRFFFAHRRHALDSVFRMRTNIHQMLSSVAPTVSAGFD